MDQLQLHQKRHLKRGDSTDSGQPDRPPRIRYFNFKRYIRELWSGSKSGSRPKMDSPLPSRMDNIQNHTLRRITSSPSPGKGISMEKRANLTMSDGHGQPSAAVSMPSKSLKGHKRRSSDEIMGGMSLGIYNMYFVSRGGEAYALLF